MISIREIWDPPPGECQEVWLDRVLFVIMPALGALGLVALMVYALLAE